MTVMKGIEDQDVERLGLDRTIVRVPPARLFARLSLQAGITGCCYYGRGRADKADFQQAFPLKEGPEKRLCFLKPLFAADTGLL